MNETKGPVQVVTIAGTHRATFHAFGVTAWCITYIVANTAIHNV